jgi:hypothetical protein
VPILGRQFFFPFSHSTRVDAAVGHLGEVPTEVELTVFNPAGTVVHRRRLLDLPPRGCVTTRHDPKSDNLARFVGANMAGLVAIRGQPNALLTASSLCIGKGLTSCAVLRPIQAAAGSLMHAPVAIGRTFHLLLANPYEAELRLRVAVAPSGEPFEPLQDPIVLGQYQVALTEDTFVMGRPALVRASSESGVPFMAWGLGVGTDRSELYPIYP